MHPIIALQSQAPQAEGSTLLAISAIIVHGLISAALVVGGIFSLKSGFKLLDGQGKQDRQQSSISVMGLKASVNSIGAFVMVTSFLWALAAWKTLPNLSVTKQGTIVSSLEQKLRQATTETEKYKAQAQQIQRELVLAKNNETQATSQLQNSAMTIEKLKRATDERASAIQANAMALAKRNEEFSSATENAKNREMEFKTIIQDKNKEIDTYKSLANAALAREMKYKAECENAKEMYGKLLATCESQGWKQK